MTFFQEWVFQFFALFQPGLGHTPGQIAHLTKKGLTLGHANGAARVQHIEGVRAFQHVIVGRDDQPLGQAGFGFGLVEVVHLAQAGYVGSLKVIFALLELILAADFTIGDALSPGFVPDGGGVVEGDQDALEARR